ncbi:MAG: DUF7694 domain-containing protein [Candidatus Saccharimonadaceae bacterium]
MEKPRLRVVQLKTSLILIHILRQADSRFLAAYRVNSRLNVIISLDGDAEEVHISISHRHRHPTWNEIKAIKYHFYPNLPMVMHFPPDPNYVNIHQNCFHLYEARVA